MCGEDWSLLNFNHGTTKLEQPSVATKLGATKLGATKPAGLL